MAAHGTARRSRFSPMGVIEFSPAALWVGPRLAVAVGGVIWHVIPLTLTRTTAGAGLPAATFQENLWSHLLARLGLGRTGGRQRKLWAPGSEILVWYFVVTSYKTANTSNRVTVTKIKSLIPSPPYFVMNF